MTETNGEKKFKFSREFSVDVPPAGRAYFIPVTEWERLKRMIRQIVPPQNWFQAGGWLFAGIAATTLIGIWQSDNPSLHFKVVAWAVVLCGAIMAIALFCLDGQQRQDITQSAQSVIDEMIELENTYAAHTEAETPAQETR